jgi:hypothetical protein
VLRKHDLSIHDARQEDTLPVRQRAFDQRRRLDLAVDGPIGEHD